MKKFIFLAVLLLTAIQSTASVVDVTTAQSKAQRFASTLTANGRHRAPQHSTSAVLVHTEASQAMPGQAVYYIFNTDDSYIIVSGDDRAEEVLAYGDSPLDINNIPEAMQCWLSGYKGQLEYLLSHPDFEVRKSARKAPERQRESVEPLLTALWDQGSPYNQECPKSGASRCITGCAATSLSMVLHYWKYPTDSTPSVPGYVTASQGLQLQELPPTTFDWDNMLDQYRRGYNADQARAVAHLMRYVGQAEQMDYTPSASGTYGENILETVKLFGYNPDAELIYKTSWIDEEDHWADSDNYSDEEWADIIQDELCARRPLVMCAYANSMGGLSGHAFNVDGYDGETDMYHVNWGWSGSGNAYFALNAFRGGSGTYNLVQQIIVGLEPPATVPTIKVNHLRLSTNSYVDRTTDITFTVKGALLTDDVKLTLNDATGAFTLQQDRIDLTDNEDGIQVIVSYTPDAVGEHTATITLSSEGAKDVTVRLKGTAILETYTPVMLDASDVNLTSFQVNWNDETPAHNVIHYNLEMANVPYSELCLHETFTEPNGASTSDCSDRLDDITTTAGWTGNKVYQGDGYLRLGNNSTKGWLETPAMDMRDSKNHLTVKVTARCTSNDENALLKIACGENDTTVLLTRDDTEYCVLLPCPADKQVHARLTNSVANRRAVITGIEVYAGDNYSPIDESTIVYHESISGNSFVVSGVSPGTYALRVQAAYSDGTISPWSNRVRVPIASLPGDVNRDGVINIADVNAVINVVLGNIGSSRTIKASDINGDGTTNIADINLLISTILQN